jgi:predicted metal-dependent hydrolase
MGAEEIRRFVESKADWLQKHLSKRKPVNMTKYTPKEIQQLREQARKRVTQRVKHYAPIIGVTYGQITIRTQHTRWGSCSSKGNLNFNCLLALVPEAVLDYIVVHELCHRKEMNHSPRFWAEVEKILPEYKHQKTWLRENGPTLVARI